MSFVDSLLNNLRGNGVLYLVCVAGIIGSFKLLGRHPQQRKYVLLGILLIMGSAIAGSLLTGILFEALVGSDVSRFTDHQKRIEDLRTYSTIAGIVWFITGAAHAAGIASLLYAVFVDKFTVSTNKKKASRRYEELDDEDDDRSRRRRPRDDDDDDRPRRRPRRDDDD